MTPGVPLDIVVLLGGPSAEHDVSIVSGSAIADALAGRGHHVRRVLIDLLGGWWWLPPDHVRGERPASVYDDPAALGAAGPFRSGAALDRLAGSPDQVVFIALHGPFGEDGTVQALLEAAGVAYTGAGVAASVIGMDKPLFKRLVRGLGLPVVDWLEIHRRRWQADRAGILGEVEAFAQAHGDDRLIVKPARLGSSVGITLAHGPDERPRAIETALRFDERAIVEVYLPGARDLEVAVVGNDPDALDVFGPGEILSGHEFYDYEAKYTPGLSWTTTHAEVNPAERAILHELTRDTYRAIGTEGFARVDFFLADGAIYLNEINTIPGFTPISLFPMLAAEGGHDFAGICERIVELAIARRSGSRADSLAPTDLPR